MIIKRFTAVAVSIILLISSLFTITQFSTIASASSDEEIVIVDFGNGSPTSHLRTVYDYTTENTDINYVAQGKSTSLKWTLPSTESRSFDVPLSVHRSQWYEGSNLAIKLFNAQSRNVTLNLVVCTYDASNASTWKPNCYNEMTLEPGWNTFLIPKEKIDSSINTANNLFVRFLSGGYGHTIGNQYMAGDIIYIDSISCAMPQSADPDSFSLEKTSVEDGAENIADYNPGYEYVFTFTKALADSYSDDIISVSCNDIPLFAGDDYDIKINENELTVCFKNGLENASSYILTLSRDFCDATGKKLELSDRSFKFTTRFSVLSDGIIFDSENPVDMKDALSNAGQDFPEGFYSRSVTDAIEGNLSFEMNYPAFTSGECRFQISTKKIDDIKSFKYFNMLLYSSRDCTDAENAQIMMYDTTKRNAWLRYSYNKFKKGWQLISIPISEFTDDGKGTMGTYADRFVFNVGGWGAPRLESGSYILERMWMSQSPVDDISFDSPEFADESINIPPDLGGDNAFNLRYTTDVLDTDYSEKIFVGKYNGSSYDRVDTYHVQSDGTNLKIIFDSELEAGSTYKIEIGENTVLSSDYAICKDAVSVIFTVFTTLGQDICLDNIIADSDSVDFEITSLSEGAELTFEIYSLDENNALVSSLSQPKQLTSDEKVVSIDYAIPTDSAKTIAYVLDSDNCILSGKYALITSDGTKFRYTYEIPGEKPELKCNYEVLEKELKISGIVKNADNAVIIKIKDSDGKLLSAGISDADSEGNFEYFYGFPDYVNSGAYKIYASSGNLNSTLEFLYLSDTDKNIILTSANTNNMQTFADTLADMSRYMNIGKLTDTLALDLSRLIITSDDYESYDDLYTQIVKWYDFLNDFNFQTWSKMRIMISDNLEALKLIDDDVFEKFEKLTVSAQNETCAILKDSLPADDYSDLTDKLSAAIKEYNSGKSKGSGGGSSSSSKKSPSGGGTFSNDFVAPKLPQANEIVFDDISDVSWARDSILNLYESGIVSASEDKKFRPDDNITREEFIKLLVVAFSDSTTASEHPFTDTVDGAWYNIYLAKAYSLGIVKGYPDMSFGIGDNITREDMVTLMGRTLEAVGKTVKSANVMNFTDSDMISDYASDYVNSFSGAGIINGMGDGSFAPGQYATRAQAAKVIDLLIGMNMEG